MATTIVASDDDDLFPMTSPLSMGTNRATVRLISSEGKELVIDEEVAKQSKIISMFLSPELGFKESQTGLVHLKDIPNNLLIRIVDFLIYKKKYEGVSNPPTWEMKAEESLDLLLVADYLEM